MRGGKRPGAGRKAKAVKQIESSIAEILFRKLGGEAKAWETLIDAGYGKLVNVGGKLLVREKLAAGTEAKPIPIDRLTFIKDILQYWTDRKYGRPAQRVEQMGDDGGPIQVVVDI